MYQVKPHLSPWFSADFAATIVHRNHFFCLHQKDKSSESKVKFRQTTNSCKRIFEAAKLAFANKPKETITSQKLGSWDFGELPIVFSTKVNLLYLLCSMVQRCYLPSCHGNHVFMVDHGYPWLFHGHVFIFHTHGEECNYSATKTWLTIVISMVITSFPMVNDSSLKKECNGRLL